MPTDPTHQSSNVNLYQAGYRTDQVQTISMGVGYIVSTHVCIASAYINPQSTTCVQYTISTTDCIVNNSRFIGWLMRQF